MLTAFKSLIVNLFESYLPLSFCTLFWVTSFSPIRFLSSSISLYHTFEMSLVSWPYIPCVHWLLPNVYHWPLISTELQFLYATSYSLLIVSMHLKIKSSKNIHLIPPPPNLLFPQFSPSQEMAFSFLWSEQKTLESILILVFVIVIKSRCLYFQTTTTTLTWTTVVLVFFFFFINLFIFYFIYFWLCWVFFAVRGLSLVAESGGYSLLWCTGFSLQWLLLLWSTGSRHAGFSSCGTWAQ